MSSDKQGTGRFPAPRSAAAWQKHKGNQMNRLADRRTVLLAVGTAAFAAAALAGTARPMEVEVTVGFEGDEFVPKGQLVVYLDDPASPDDARSLAEATNVGSDGGSRNIDISLPLPPGADTSSPQQIVARLERPDGWLLARGSTQLDTGAPVIITLYTVMY